MKPYILMGYGMMQMTEELLKDWNGGNVILNPRILTKEQLINCSKNYKKNNAVILFDPHCYVPRSDKPILKAQEYWFKGEYSTNSYCLYKCFSRDLQVKIRYYLRGFCHIVMRKCCDML